MKKCQTGGGARGGFGKRPHFFRFFFVHPSLIIYALLSSFWINRFMRFLPLHCPARRKNFLLRASLLSTSNWRKEKKSVPTSTVFPRIDFGDPPQRLAIKIQYLPPDTKLPVTSLKVGCERRVNSNIEEDEGKNDQHAKDFFSVLPKYFCYLASFQSFALSSQITSPSKLLPPFPFFDQS